MAVPNPNHVVGDMGAEIKAGGDHFRAAGLQETFADSVSNSKDTVGNTTRGLADKVKNPIDTVGNIPMSPGYSIENFGKDVLTPTPDSMAGALESVTGVNINGLVGEIPSGAQIKNMVTSSLDGIQRELIREIDACIEKYLAELLRKIPELKFIFDLEGQIAKLIGGLRNKLQLKIRTEMEKLIHQKIKLHQIALFKQKITSSIRGICEDSSPTRAKKYQTDPLFKGNAIQDGAKKIKKQVEEDMVAQTKGHDVTNVNDFINDSGEVVSVDDNTLPKAIITASKINFWKDRLEQLKSLDIAHVYTKCTTSMSVHDVAETGSTNSESLCFVFDLGMYKNKKLQNISQIDILLPNSVYKPPAYGEQSQTNIDMCDNFRKKALEKKRFSARNLIDEFRSMQSTEKEIAERQILTLGGSV